MYRDGTTIGALTTKYFRGAATTIEGVSSSSPSVRKPKTLTGRRVAGVLDRVGRITRRNPRIDSACGIYNT